MSQCQCLTKSGSQCSRKATTGFYCTQHSKCLNPIGAIQQKKQIIEKPVSPNQQLSPVMKGNIDEQMYDYETCNVMTCQDPSTLKKTQIIERYMENKHPSSDPVFILLFGGAAAGKSSGIRKIINKSIMPVPLEEFIYIDIDDLRLESDEYRKNINGGVCREQLNLKEKPWLWEKSTGTLGQPILMTEKGYVNDKGRFVSAKNAMEGTHCRAYSQQLSWSPPNLAPLGIYLKNNYNVIYNTICFEPLQCINHIFGMVPNHYNIYLVGVKCDPNVALLRSRERSLRQGRLTPDDFVYE